MTISVFYSRATPTGLANKLPTNEWGSSLSFHRNKFNKFKLINLRSAILNNFCLKIEMNSNYYPDVKIKEQKKSQDHVY